MTDGYDWWRRALAGEPIGGAALPVNDSDCQPGFWRKRTSRAGPFVPVATWLQDGKMIALVDGREADAAEAWTYICRYPITEEQYHSRVQTGTWHDEDSNVSQSLAPPSAGHNQPPQDEAEILASQIDAASANAAEYETISDDATASKAQSARARLNELSGQADKRREALKKPHLEAGKAVDATWQPLVKRAKAAADAIASALGAHETRKAREAAEIARKAEEARRMAEQEALKAAEAGKPAPAPVAAPPTPPVAAEPTTAIRGAYGRAASVKTVKVATVTDYAAAAGYLINQAGVKDAIDKAAQKAVDAGFDVPGVTVEEHKKVV
jgi:hypothetical protein